MEVTLALEISGDPIRGLVLQCPISSTFRAARAHGSNVVMSAIGYKMFAMNNDRKIKQLRTKTLILKALPKNLWVKLRQDSFGLSPSGI